MSEVYILFGATLAVAFFAVATFIVVVSYHKSLKRQRELEVELEKLKESGNEAARAIIAQAQTKANEIVASAQIKSQEIVRAGEIFSSDFKAKFQADLSQVPVLIQQESGKMLSNISNNIGSQFESEMKVFHDTVIAETSKIKDSLSAGMKVAYEKAQTEVDEYKKQMMDRINSSILVIVEDAAKKALGASLSREEHEKIILKALDEAKKQNVF